MNNDISLLFTSVHVLIILVFYPSPIVTSEGKSLGYFSECRPGRKFEGEVIVKNEREIVIPEFYYDGRGPSVWFHAMSKGAQAGVHSSNNLSFYTLPFPGASCDRVKGYNYKGEGIKLILPVSIYELETIGMFDYQSCQNYGNVSIPSNLVVEAAPEDLLVTHICPKSTFKPCLSNGETKNGGKDCKAVDSGVISTQRTDYNGYIAPHKILSGTSSSPGSQISLGIYTNIYFLRWVITLMCSLQNG